MAVSPNPKEPEIAKMTNKKKNHEDRSFVHDLAQEQNTKFDSDPES